MSLSGVGQISRFYELLAALERKVGGCPTQSESLTHKQLPRRGVYFFFEPGEARTTSGRGPRVVRVGTHALNANAHTTLWGRLKQHRGTLRGRHPGGGNHRGSVFRKHVGEALIARESWDGAQSGEWGRGSSAAKEIREREARLEVAVSAHIRSMPFIWLGIQDAPGPDSLRGWIERNSLALLSNHHRVADPIDPPSATWLGSHARSSRVRSSGLWNSNHVDAPPEAAFLDLLESMILT